MTFEQRKAYKKSWHYEQAVARSFVRPTGHAFVRQLADARRQRMREIEDDAHEFLD